MIQVYNPDNTNYDQNGDMTLFPESANTHAVLNGSWDGTLEHPIDEEGRWRHLIEDAVIKLPSFNGEQLYRIKKKDKSDSGVVCDLEPIFFDSIGDCYIENTHVVGKNGQEALNLMVASNPKYSGESNITRAATAYYEDKNLIQAINGDENNSFINRWGGEILFDNHRVIINDRVGGDYGVELRYGKNIKADGLTETVDTSSVVTRIYPKAYNGYRLSAKYVDSPLIASYPTVKTATMTFEDVKMVEDATDTDEDNGAIICQNQEELDAALIAKCEEQFSLGLDKPTITITADMVLLQDTELYKDYKVLETVSLGDTIHCKHTRLGIITDARVIELKYDSVTKKVSSVVLGEFQYDYFKDSASKINRIDKAIRPDGSLMAERVQGILNGIYTQLRLQSTVAKKVSGRAFLIEDLDEESDLYGCMVWGTQGLQLSTTRTADGKDWDFTTAMTAKGIVANAIIAGILSDKTGKNYWNLDTGEFRLSSEAFKVNDQTVQTYVDGEIDKKIKTIRTITLQLSNEYQGISTDYLGNGGDYSECYFDVKLFIGSTDITSNSAVGYTIVAPASITGAWDSTNKRYTVTDLSADNATVQVTANYAGLETTRTFSVTKTKGGIPGIQGIQGEQGIPGEKGEAGEPGQDGKDGIGINSVTVTYGQSGSPSTKPTIWSSDVPTVSAGQYLWIRTITDYTDSGIEDTVTYTYAKQGEDGEKGETGNTGTSVKVSSIQYQVGTSAATAPTGTWSNSVVSVPEGQYLWTKTTFSDGNIAYGVARQGENGADGKDGANGKTPYFHIKYSPVESPTADQMTEIPDVYIGTYVDYTINDSTDPAAYTWARFQGIQGETGTQGIPGTNGENGQTSYLHIKYSDDGGTTFTSNDGEVSGKYIGQYVDFTQEDSTDPTAYKWSLIKGSDGADAVVYSVEPSVLIMEVGKDNSIIPETVTFYSYYKKGSNTRASYLAKFRISESTDGVSYTVKYESSKTEYSYTYTPSSEAVKFIRCVLYSEPMTGIQTTLDTQTVAIVRDVASFTQEEMFNILTNNGAWQGFFTDDSGNYYINATYINTGNLAGWIIDKANKRIISPDGTIILDAKNNTITTKSNEDGYSTTIGAGTLETGDLKAGTLDVESNATLGSNNTSYVKIRDSFVSADEEAEDSEVCLSGKFHATNSFIKLYNLEHYANGGHLVFNSDGAELAYGGTSSKRYKDHIRNIEESDIEAIYSLPVALFKYKEGHLSPKDPHNGEIFIGLYAEDVEKLFPHAAVYKRGLVEDWDEHGIIPIMIKALQDQKRKIDQLESKMGGIQ